MKIKKATTEDGKNIRVYTYTEDEFRDAEVKYLEALIDSLQAIMQGIEKGAGNCWVYDGEVGSYLRTQAEVYDNLVKAMTLEN